MKTTKYILLYAIMILASEITAQESSTEKYGKTLNMGIGLGYYGYVGHSMPVLHADYEFDIANNFTLAPFIALYTYKNHYYWGNSKYPYRDYSYRETVIPIGVKGTYYFDQFLNAGPKWDFYLAASLGFSIRNTSWESDYYGDTRAYHSSSYLYIDAHIGTEYKLNPKTGLFVDLSSGVSTLGLAIHL